VPWPPGSLPPSAASQQLPPAHHREHGVGRRALGTWLGLPRGRAGRGSWPAAERAARVCRPLPTAALLAHFPHWTAHRAPVPPRPTPSSAHPHLCVRHELVRLCPHCSRLRSVVCRRLQRRVLQGPRRPGQSHARSEARLHAPRRPVQSHARADRGAGVTCDVEAGTLGVEREGRGPVRPPADPPPSFSPAPSPSRAPAPEPPRPPHSA